MKRYAVFFLALSILLIVYSVWSAGSAHVAIKRNAPDSVFSAQRAFLHLQNIARAPHSLGTAEHERVKGYIIETLRQMGLSPEILQTTVFNRNSYALVVARVSNILVRIKGSLPGKAILMAAHYDSQPNTPGAGDDGIGVVALLEAARALKSSAPLQHDIILLLTDGEEEGLFGAKAFVEEYPDWKNIAVIINWDFRGNRGNIINYETSAENGWLIRQYGAGAPYPFASSMAYEVSKLLPNFTDFTEFKKTGITGFSNGLLGGFVNYHSMTDRPENLDQSSLQQLGDNILGMAKRLGRVSLDNTKSGDLSYVNIFGYQLIWYPTGLNLFIAIAASILFAIILFSSFRKKEINAGGFAVSFIGLPLTIAAAIFLSGYCRRIILWSYPLYSHFYENNAYNSGWYFLFMTIVSVFIFMLVYRFMYRKWGFLSVYAGILLNIIIIMWLCWIFIPSATFLFAIPGFFLTAGLQISRRQNFKMMPWDFGAQGIRFFSILPAILLFSPLCYLLFTSFGLGNEMPFVGLPLILFCAMLFPLWEFVFQIRRWIPVSVIAAALIFSLIGAGFHSGFDSQHPLHTNLRYRLNVNDSTADWLSDFTGTDKFTKKFFPDERKDTSFKDYYRLIHAAPVFNYPSPVATLLKDSTMGNERELVLHCNSSRSGVNTMTVSFDNSVHIKRVSVFAGKPESPEQINHLPAPNYIVFYVPPPEGFILTVNLRAGENLGMYLLDRSMGLPIIKGLTEYPEDIISGTDFNCNTLGVRKHFSF
jgi:Peptidase family M28